MSGFADAARDKYSLMRAGEAWRNGAGLATLLGTFVAFSALVVLGTAGNPPVIVALAGLTGWLVLLVGGTAAGVQFMQQALGQSVYPPGIALATSPPVLLRTLGLLLVLALVVAGFVAVAFLLLAACRILAFGEVLYIVVLPTLTLAATLILLLVLAAALLVAPALWEGRTLRHGLEQLSAVALQRPKETVLRLAALLLFGAIAAAAILAFLAIGFGAAAGLSALVLPDASIMIGPGTIGTGIVVGVATALVMAVLYMGVALTYLKLTRGVEIAPLRGLLKAAARKRVAEAAAWTHAACPTCGRDVAASDAFCSHCGRQLK